MSMPSDLSELRTKTGLTKRRSIATDPLLVLCAKPHYEAEHCYWPSLGALCWAVTGEKTSILPGGFTVMVKALYKETNRIN